MPVLKKHLTPLSKKGQIVKHAGKGAVSQALPPHRMSTVAPGSPINRTMNNYAKATPMAQPLASPLTPNPGDEGM